MYASKLPDGYSIQLSIPIYQSNPVFILYKYNKYIGTFKSYQDALNKAIKLNS